jgi:hypothetical protein
MGIRVVESKSREEEERRFWKEKVERWKEGLKKTFGSDQELKRLVYEEIKSVTRLAKYGSPISFDDFAEMLHSVADKVRSYVEKKYGIKLENCTASIDALPKWPNYFKQEIEKNKPLSSVRLSVACTIPFPKEFERVEVYEIASYPYLEIEAPLFFLYDKDYETGKWGFYTSQPPYDVEDIRVQLSEPL